MTTAVETKWKCDNCGEICEREELVQVRECRDESCAEIFNGTEDGNACPACEKGSRLLTKRGCPACVSEEGCTELEVEGEGEEQKREMARGALPVPTYRSDEMNIIDIKPGTRFRKDPLKGLDSLIASMQRVGLLQSPVVLESGQLVDGRRRIEALKALGETKTQVRIAKNLEDALLIAERDANMERLDFTATEADAIARAIEPKLKAEAKERQRQGGKQKEKPRGTSHKQKGKTRDLLANATGKSPRTLTKIKEVVESGRQDLIEEMDKTGKVDAVHKKLREKWPLDPKITAAITAAGNLIRQVQDIEKALDNGSKATPKLINDLWIWLSGFEDLANALYTASKPAEASAR